MDSPDSLLEEWGYRSSGNNLPVAKEPKDPASADHGPRVLPLVMRMRHGIDQIFSRYVGPISSELSAEEFDRWRAEGQVGPSGLRRYISRLAGYIPEDGPRREFIGYASRCIQVMTVTKG